MNYFLRTFHQILNFSHNLTNFISLLDAYISQFFIFGYKYLDCLLKYQSVNFAFVDVNIKTGY